MLVAGGCTFAVADPDVWLGFREFHYEGSTVKYRMIVVVMIALQAVGAPLKQDIVVERALDWMNGNPIMVNASHSVALVQAFPAAGADYFVYVVSLSPVGYLVLNSDDRLPQVVSFSAESSVNLLDVPENTFREILLRHVEQMEELLADQDAMKLMEEKSVLPFADELFGPYLDTEWNQCNPYNKLCPDDPEGGYNGYGGRVPVGCAPTAYAQVLAFHRWPVAGEGSHSYTDTGSISGEHSADFSDTYDWGSMLKNYAVFGSNPLDSEDAVSELMYELGVVAEVDYESVGTSSSIETLGGRIAEHLYYESNEYQDGQSNLIVPMEADLRAGFPCVVAVPGHAIVVDGLMVNGGVTTYHFNYGWGGSNNGWYDADSTPLGGLVYGVTSIRPRLMAVPQTNEVAGAVGGSVEVKWLLPKRLTNDVSRLEVMSMEKQTGIWQSDASEITCQNIGWDVVDAGHPGDCWFTGANSYASLLLGEIFVPDVSSKLTFWQCARLYISLFSVEVSSDDGASYDTLYSTPNDIYEFSWSEQTLDLGAYAGQNILVRFVLSESGGAYYDEEWAGIRVDDLAVTSGDWYAWESFAVDTVMTVLDAENEAGSELGGQPVFCTVLTNLPLGTHTLAAVLTDTDLVPHGVAPSFVLSVDDGDGIPRVWEDQYGLDTSSDDGDDDLDDDGYSNLDEYICGTIPTNSASCWRIEIDISNLPVFNALEERLYTIEYCTNLQAGVWNIVADNIQGSNGVISVYDYHSASNSLGFYRVDARMQ